MKVATPPRGARRYPEGIQPVKKTRSGDLSIRSARQGDEASIQIHVLLRRRFRQGKFADDGVWNCEVRGKARYNGFGEAGCTLPQRNEIADFPCPESICDRAMVERDHRHANRQAFIHDEGVCLWPYRRKDGDRNLITEQQGSKHAGSVIASDPNSRAVSQSAKMKPFAIAVYEANSIRKPGSDSLYRRRDQRASLVRGGATNEPDPHSTGCSGPG